ncbi:MAG TPA: hypothetical protein PKD10_05210 [Paracoccaceae bacterium]|nr:hypothetical protein [Paracoccaceae bacterium]HMO70091.1 hypothetical protein [Paracoccaceae bacterium]
MKNSQDQIDRFREAARDLGSDESDDALDQVMGKLDLKKPSTGLTVHEVSTARPEDGVSKKGGSRGK